MKTVIVFLADGLEECEGLIIVDLLRRAGIHVITASITGSREIHSSHGITFYADALAEEVDYAAADMVVLPGGKAGTERLAASSLVKEQCLAFAADRSVSAICAAPSVLAAHGLLEGKEATCHPDFEPKMHGALLTHSSVAVSGNIITGRGLGAAIPFALELIRTLLDEGSAQRIAEAICWKD